MNCLALGPDGPRHVFAGCVGGVIYESDASDPIPLLSWSPVQEPLPTGQGKVSAAIDVSVPSAAGNVNDIVVLGQHRLIVAACNGGLVLGRDSRDAAKARLPGFFPTSTWTSNTLRVAQSG